MLSNDEIKKRAAELDEHISRKRGMWQQWYAEYLQTNEWKERRRLVLERADGICEGCRQEPATEVHHTSYVHVGNEFLWELVAICRWCHARYHEVRHG
jgi:hypothetical protein